MDELDIDFDPDFDELTIYERLDNIENVLLELLKVSLDSDNKTLIGVRVSQKVLNKLKNIREEMRREQKR